MERVSKETVKTKESLPRPDIASLERHSWRNWFLLAAATLITTIGLATAIPPLLSERIVSPWPWVKTDLVLLIGLSLTVLVFIGYLTQQQRNVASILKRLRKLQDERSEQIHQNNSRAYALLSVSKIMGSETDLQSIFDTITKMCVETFNCRRASLMLVDKEMQELVVRSVSGQSSVKIINMRQGIGEGFSGWAVTHRKALFLRDPSDLENYPELEGKNPFIHSAMIVPIILRDDVVGVLNVNTNSPDIKYDTEDLKMLQVVAENAGACIRHKEHTDWMRMMADKLRERNFSSVKMCSANKAVEGSGLSEKLQPRGNH